jgi:hypothetical protein
MYDEIRTDGWTIEQIRETADSIITGAKAARRSEKLGYIKGRLQALPASVCNVLEPLVLETERIVRRDAQHSKGHLQTWEKVTLFVFGALFLILLVLIALKIPEPKPFQKNVFCVALSISAACIGAIVPGLIHVEGKVWTLVVRAAGAIAFGVFVEFMCMH